ncbi:MAG: helicase C-terminal domain-containing protein [Nanoarchaeota archaeon]|mgnify:CR=1 FL=1
MKSGVMENVFYNEGWSLLSSGKELEPLIFSNGKNQKDIVDEVVGHIKSGKKIVFINGVCGTGKSAIALNIARRLGRASIVVPVKALQKQYEQDYMGKMGIIKTNGSPLKISMITGRENHKSLYKEDANCADPYLPDTIKLIEKNYDIIKRFYKDNPLMGNKDLPPIKTLRRISIAPANPYWSPLVPADKDMPLSDARKKRYRGLGGQDFIFYHRKEGCGYYDQYQAYIDSDVIIFNSAKYKIETLLNRKPETDVDIIDEADEFLDSFANQQSINLTKLGQSLTMLANGNPDIVSQCKEIVELIEKEEMDKGPLMINEDSIYPLEETSVYKILRLLLTTTELENEIHQDELTYLSKGFEIAAQFIPFSEQTFLTFRRDDKDLFASLVTTNLSQQFRELVDKNKAIVLMSGTLHNPKLIEKVFGVPGGVVVDAEIKAPGVIEIIRTGKEFDCKYSTFQAKKKTREDYLKALDLAIGKAPRPTLVHINAFEDLPSEMEKQLYGLKNVMTKGELNAQQEQDKDGEFVRAFKRKDRSILFSTKCSRGIDFPGDICNSIVFTKYPNPNMNDTFWKVLQQTHAEFFWEFYRDKARREFLQRVYRALRSEKDHVYVLSPDLRVLDAVRGLQMIQGKV